MKDLEEKLRNSNKFTVYKVLTEKDIKEVLEEVKDLNDINYNSIKAENIEDKEKEFKELRLAIKNTLNGNFYIKQALDSETIKSLSEEIAKEYLK